MKLNLPYVPLSQERRSELEQLLCAGNSLLKKYHELAKKKNGKSERSKFLNEVAKAIDSDGAFVQGIHIPLVDALKIIEVKKVEAEIVEGFSLLLAKIANRKVEKEIDPSLSFDDLMSEACHALVRAISNYTDSQYRLSTFFHACVSRHLAKICGTTTRMSTLSRKTHRHKVVCKRLLAEEGATFDSVVQQMGLTPKQISTLSSVLCNVNLSSDLEPGEYSKAVLDHKAEENSIDRHKVAHVLGRLDLSELELAVLKGFVGSSTRRLGLAEESKKLINPRTNKPYSRMALTYAWRRVKEKIEEAYKKAA